jgi:hypothetical protein
MKTILAFLALAATVPHASAQLRAYLPYAGRWDLTIQTPTETYPAWMEVSDRDGVVTIVVVGKEGGLHGSDRVRLEPLPVTTEPGLNDSAVRMGDKTVATRLAFSTVENFGKQVSVEWVIESAGNKVTGTQKRADGVEGKITGEHAPSLKRKPPAKWSAPEPLFNGKDLTGWEPMGSGENHWKAEDGTLVNVSAGANLRSTRKLDDFKLHAEFNCPRGCNSGIFLRGRYELQIEYGAKPAAEASRGMGAIFGFLAPSVTAPPTPGEWETLDVTLVGRTVTVVRNGMTIIDSKPIPGITGGAIDSREALPGPIYLQGDATDGIRFRKIETSVPSK